MFGHPLLKSVYSVTYRHACSVSCNSHAAPAYLLRALAPKGTKDRSRRGKLSVHSFISLMLFYLMALLFSVRLKKDMIVPTKREREH